MSSAVAKAEAKESPNAELKGKEEEETNTAKNQADQIMHMEQDNTEADANSSKMSLCSFLQTHYMQKL